MGYVTRQAHAIHVEKICLHMYVRKFAYCSYIIECRYFKINTFKRIEYPIKWLCSTKRKIPR